jgi:hypothetical protein
MFARKYVPIFVYTFVWTHPNFTMKPDSTVLKQKVDSYVHFSFDERLIKVPYCLVHSRFQFWNTKGKGNPKQLRNQLSKAALKEGVVLSLLSESEITRFMRKNNIGIECSGFVYQVLDAALRDTGELPLHHCFHRSERADILNLLLFRINPQRRISADMLTDLQFTKEVKMVSEIEVGDLLRLSPRHWSGKHVAIVVELDDHVIRYAHSSKDTIEQGPHYGEIEISDPTKGLEWQNWLELTKDGKNYGEVSYRVQHGDGVRRLLCQS